MSLREFGWTLLVTSILIARVTALDASVSPRQLLLAEDGKARASIVLGEGASPAYRYAATELLKYLHDLCGAQFSVIPEAKLSSKAKQQTLIFVGGPAVNASLLALAQKLRLNLTRLKAGGFVIKTGRFKGHPSVVVAGQDGFSTLYGVYNLVERLGATFLLTGDILPRPRAVLSVPRLDVRQEPAFRRRGFLLQEAGYDNLTTFSYQDYSNLLDQMAKMKCNYLQFWWFPFAPWLKYSYRGETKWMGDVSTKESGYLTWAHGEFGPRTTEDVSIGTHWFVQFLKGTRVAPPEMQKVQTPDQAFAVAENLLHRIIHHAHERGIKVWLAIEMAALPPNLARYCERVGTLPFHGLFGTFVEPLDPANRQIQTNRLRALFTTYPNADGYFLVFAEMYPEIDVPRYQRYYERMRAKFFQLRALRWPWVWDIAESSDLVVDSNIGYMNLFKYLLKQRDEVDPKASIGLMAIGRGYALPLFDKMLPRNIPFTDMESSGAWTPTGIPMQDFGNMGTRERTMEPRVDDDFDMMGMQFNVTQFAEKDHILSDGIKVGLSGFAGQVNRVRGTETNSLYLAEAAWKPNLTPREFYEDYSRRIFGATAAPDMYRALMILEKNQQYEGYNNYGFSTLNCCGAVPEVGEAYAYSQQPDPYDGPTLSGWKRFIIDSPDAIDRYEGSMLLLDEALRQMQTALPKVASRGCYELHYMINRTESYRDYMHSLVTIRKGYLLFDRTFQDKPHLSHQEFVERLEESLSEFRAGEEQAKAATRKYAQLIDNPSDLGVLYHLNARVVLGLAMVRQWMQDVANFQEGKPYLEHVGWQRLFTPYPHFGTAP
jgi:hypothetical protein